MKKVIHVYGVFLNSSKTVKKFQHPILIQIKDEISYHIGKSQVESMIFFINRILMLKVIFKKNEDGIYFFDLNLDGGWDFTYRGRKE